MAHGVRRRRRSSMRGQNLVLAAGLTVLGIVVVLTLREFMTRDDGARRTTDPRYLVDERTVTGRRRTATSAAPDGTVVASAEGGADAGSGRTGSGTGSPVSSARQRTFSHRGGSAVFASRDGALPRALNPDLRDMVASPEVLVRLLGTAQGDFIYHREYGWMRFVDGHWEPVDPYRLPEDLKTMYPALCGVNTASGDGGGDAQFSRTDWSSSLGLVEEGS